MGCDVKETQPGLLKSLLGTSCHQAPLKRQESHKMQTKAEGQIEIHQILCLLFYCSFQTIT